MTTLTLQVSNDKHERLSAIANEQGLSVARLIDETMSNVLAEYEAKKRFENRAKQGDIKKAMALLDKAL
ncbi:ribbon-helix-helix domain-containing protein [Moraxella bovis]|uniref:ribbon-helix-helix domain-containing protein n=1 Tax=Moraxella bovis TaxID=476 RepID=UPI002226E8C5|nr:ribbon-helix-helix domain-containing protein [Moraxella bovis]UZA24335.1 ribbon-helix-helix domain-containing protein [Moraxella bovis]UZA30587.1 ribbon-helix-helix domain-containing protein [Moraxella bovis]